jgi:hypothetical protein
MDSTRWADRVRQFQDANENVFERERSDIELGNEPFIA